MKGAERNKNRLVAEKTGSAYSMEWNKKIPIVNLSGCTRLEKVET